MVKDPIRHFWGGLLAATLLILLWEASGWDLVVTRWYGTSAGFAWRDAWWSATLLHAWGRDLALLFLLGLAVDAARPLLVGPSRAERLYWLGVMVFSALAVPALKRWSLTSCPWELAEFGGTAHYVPHWRLGFADGGTGHCFPCGHAVSAWACMGLYFLWRPYRPRLARGLLLGIAVIGAVFAWVQLVRGAHFVSHSLWSAWLCAVIAAGAQGLKPLVLAKR